MSQMQKDIDRLDEWQKNWQTNGFLPDDIKQNCKIEIYREYILELREDVKKLNDKIHKMEIEQAKQ